MIATREWYQGRDDGRAWALKQAMFTINNAMHTRETNSADPSEQGRVTWLRSLDAKGKPWVSDIRCPLAKVPTTLEGKDWTRYEGVLHTDHAVREEFFLDREMAPTASKPYLMDFTYLFRLFVDSRVVDLRRSYTPDFCHDLFLEALTFQGTQKYLTILGHQGSLSPRNPRRA